MRNPEGSPVVKKRYYYLRDALGSVVAVTNDQGAVVRRHVYSDPYGEDVSNDTIVTGAPSNPWRFAGEYFDSETDLYKIGERYLDPALARWTQKDPMMQAFSPREANGYAYAGDDPVNITDPKGTCFGWDACESAVDDVDSAIDEAGDRLGNLTPQEGFIAGAIGLGGAAACEASSLAGPVARAVTCSAALAADVATFWQAGETSGNDLP
jgi:RHS repeat-associated protein